MNNSVEVKMHTYKTAKNLHSPHSLLTTSVYQYSQMSEINNVTHKKVNVGYFFAWFSLCINMWHKNVSLENISVLSGSS